MARSRHTPPHEEERQPRAEHDDRSDREERLEWHERGEALAGGAIPDRVVVLRAEHEARGRELLRVGAPRLLAERRHLALEDEALGDARASWRVPPKST